MTRCLMAYTLNGKQPVVCTIVADQPYFYCEEEDTPQAIDFWNSPDWDDDVDMIGESGDYEGLDADLRELKAKINKYERVKEDTDKPRVPAFDLKLSAFDVVELHRLVAKSRLLQTHMPDGLRFITRTTVENSELHRAEQLVMLNPFVSLGEAFLLLTREIRRASKPFVHYLEFIPDDAILFNRVCKADEMCFMLRAAWEMKLSGWPDAWERLIFGPATEVFRSFHREAVLDFRTLANGKAITASFEAYFLSTLINRTDRKVIQQMLADFQNRYFAGNLRKLTVKDLIDQTTVDGKSYISKYIGTVTEDPVFTEVRDQSNANFLWFIKFEQSFRQTENEVKEWSGE